MRKFLAIGLMVIPLALFALVMGLELTQNKVLHVTTAEQLGNVDFRQHDYLSVTHGSIALDGPYLPQRVGDTDYVPIFAVTAAGTQAASPSLIALLPAGALAGLLQPPDRFDAPRRIDVLGLRSATCADVAETTLPANDPPLPCLTHGKHPHALTGVVVGSVIMLLPFVGLGVWLWRRRTPIKAPQAPPAYLVKLGKVVMVVLIFGAIAVAKLGDDVLPVALKTATPVIDSAPVATKVLDTVLAYTRSEAFAADVVNYGCKLASLQKSLNTLDIAPGDTLEVHLIQLDARSTYTRDALGAFRRQSASALIEHQIHLNGDIVGGKFFATDTADHWPAVALRQRVLGGPVELIAEQTVRTAKGANQVRIAGEIAFLEGDALRYQRRDKVVFRYTDSALPQITDKQEKIFQVVGRNLRLGFAMSNLRFEAEDDTLRVRSTGPNRRIFRP